MAIGNVKVKHDCSIKHMRMGTARMKYDISRRRRQKEEGIWK